MNNYYCSNSDIFGESSCDLSQVTDHLVGLCGLGKTLDIGSGEGLLVELLLRCGCDAYGIDVSQTVVDRCNSRLPERFHCGSVLDLPFEDNSFNTIVSTDCLEHLTPEDIPIALGELYRVCGSSLFLQIATTQVRDGHWHLTVEGRAWWERRCLEAGFIKHPRYYQLNDYEALNHDDWQIYILLQKLPTNSIVDYPLSALEAERGLHMDMLRDVGERSDAHVIRYHWASAYLKPGDRILDAACGLGYGIHTLKNITSATELTGIDGSESSIIYASAMYGDSTRGIKFKHGLLPDALKDYPNGSFDVVVSFETLEHVEDPQSLLAEFYRVLTPGGRVLVSVPNDWSDETGNDPNPYHLHVYDWMRLKQELTEHYILEDAYAQTASRHKVKEKGNTWQTSKRFLRSVPLTADAPMDCEWWLMTGMKSPLDKEIPYIERVFANLVSTEHPSVQYAEYYAYPWLMHSMVNAEYRLKNRDALNALANQVMLQCPANSNDYAAALCVLSYLVLVNKQDNHFNFNEIMTAIDAYLGLTPSDPMSLRWRVSLLFVKAKLLESIGQLLASIEVYHECATTDVSKFGVHLATKVTEAAYRAGMIAYSTEDTYRAAESWRQGVGLGKTLLNYKLNDILISQDSPNLFNHGDGVREYALAWDNIARCANGLHLLQDGRPLEFRALNNSFTTEYAGVTQNLLQTREYLNEHLNSTMDIREILRDRTVRLEQISDDLIQRTKDLENTRETLRDRTLRLEQLSKDLTHQNYRIERLPKLVRYIWKL